MKIEENMSWPPLDFLAWKMLEHSTWYSGDSQLLTNFYTEYASKNIFNLPYQARSMGFWGRQVKNKNEVAIHVPIAGDIAETSANFLFAEAPLIKVAQAHIKGAVDTSYKSTQDELDTMLDSISIERKLLEAAESCAAVGGVYIKIAWDEEISPYPIPVIEQADKAIPEFSFGILKAVTFWKTIEVKAQGTKVYRLLERYERGSITYALYLGTADRLGVKVSLQAHPETAELTDIETVDALLAVYIPNMLPNRLDRASYLGRSDLSGIEGLMESLDETFSSWIKDVALAQARLLLPESYLSKTDTGSRFNVDQMFYAKLDIDPTFEGSKITPVQFAIRAEQFEKTALNLLERIITSAGYSPQSFGLNIQGRAESGIALSMRERKSFATKGKKEKYWGPAVKRLIELMILVYNYELSGSLEEDAIINVSFSDGVTNNLSELASSVKMLSDALAVSTETKVRLIHPEWSEEQVAAEIKLVLEENNIGPIIDPDTVGLNNNKVVE